MSDAAGMSRARKRLGHHTASGNSMCTLPAPPPPHSAVPRSVFYYRRTDCRDASQGLHSSPGLCSDHGIKQPTSSRLPLKSSVKRRVESNCTISMGSYYSALPVRERPPTWAVHQTSRRERRSLQRGRKRSPCGIPGQAPLPVMDMREGLALFPWQYVLACCK